MGNGAVLDPDYLVIGSGAMGMAFTDVLVMAHPDTDIDWLRNVIADTLNGARWRREPALRAWLVDSRLDPFSRRPEELVEGPEHTEILNRIRTNVGPALANLERLLAELEESDAGR